MPGDHYAWGTRVNRSDLTMPFAVGFVRAVKKHDYAKVIQTRRSGDREGVVFDLEPELPQHPAADIRRVERICTTFGPDPQGRPVVLALRKDFPSDLLHLNLSGPDEPRDLCLFAQDYDELAANLTPELLLERIAGWLARAAVDESHLPDQPLEPFLLDGMRVIFAPDIFERASSGGIFALEQLSKEPRPVFRVRELDIGEEPPPPPCTIAVPLVAEPWHARMIHHAPGSLTDLCHLLSKADIDLIAVLQKKARELRNHNWHETLLKYRFLLLVRLPKTRKPDTEVESYEDWAFLVGEEIGNLGVKLGVFVRHDGHCWLPAQLQELHDLDDVGVVVTRPIHALDRGLASQLAGTTGGSTHRITAIGAGALGSHIILNLARQGIGQWLIIDEDQLLPHNNARHALSPRYEGQNKAETLAFEIRTLLNDAEAAKGIVRNVLRTCGDGEEHEEAFVEADHIFDFSVSPAVSRHLAVVDGSAPRSCAFLLRGGIFLVVLSEGLGRKVRLDDLELQLAVVSMENEALHGLFDRPESAPVRYAAACRDVSVQLAQDVVATHAGIASQWLRQNLTWDQPSMVVWCLSHDDLTLRRVDIRPELVHVHELDGWTVRFSHHAEELMRCWRAQRLPNETGGVLLGDMDVLSKIVYVGSILPSPPDSTEWPTTYIRGVKGLPQQIQAIHGATGGQIGYVGEWHSHPDGRGTTPSADDKRAHKWIAEHMAETGHPGLLAIQGERSELHLMLRSI